MQILTKQIGENEYICYLKDNNGQNLKAEIGKTVTEATTANNLLCVICMEELECIKYKLEA